MRILAITQMYPRPRSRLHAPFNAHQFGQLAKMHQTRVICPVPWTSDGFLAFGHAPAYVNSDGIYVEHPNFFFIPKLFRHYYGHFYLMSIKRCLGRAVEEFRPDVILSSWAHPDGWAAVQVGREFGIPVVIKVIGSDVLIISKDQRRRQRVSEALRGADAVAAVSIDLANQVAKLGAERNRIHVIPEGIDHERFFPGDQAACRAALNLAPQGKRLLFVGNLLFSKGVGILLQACDLLLRRRTDFHCDVVGKGRDEPALRSLAARLGLSGVVTFQGARPQTQLRDWYCASDLVVLPSFSEGIPNVLREAMMCGRGFIATSVGGIPEITQPSVGTLVEPGDPKQLAEGVNDALSKPFAVDRSMAAQLNITWTQSARMLADALTTAFRSYKSRSFASET